MSLLPVSVSVFIFSSLCLVKIRNQKLIFFGFRACSWSISHTKMQWLKMDKANEITEIVSDIMTCLIETTLLYF